MMVSEDCVFCKMVAGQIPVIEIYSDQAVLAFLDIAPVSNGHILVIPKQHCQSLHECPVEILEQVAGCIGIIAKAVADAMGAEGYNVLCNNGKAAGQVVGHLHFHIIPRKSGDGVFNRWPAYKYASGDIEKIAEKIRKEL